MGDLTLVITNKRTLRPRIARLQYEFRDGWHYISPKVNGEIDGLFLFGMDYVMLVNQIASCAVDLLREHGQDCLVDLVVR